MRDLQASIRCRPDADIDFLPKCDQEAHQPVDSVLTAVLENLLRQKKRTAEEKRLAELLTLLIEEFEEKEYALPAGDPIDMLRHLMDSNNLRQVDLLDVFGTASVVSEVLKGKRELSKAHITRLSARFHLSPAVFFS